MGITLNKQNDVSIVRLDGVIDISVAAELKSVLLEALDAAKGIHVSAEAVTELDVTAFQLLWAAEREAKRIGLRLELAGELPEAVDSSLAKAGFAARDLPRHSSSAMESIL
jgi:anti-anti-sigma factor